VSPPRTCFSADPVLGEVDLRWPGVSLSRCELAEGTMRPGGYTLSATASDHRIKAVATVSGVDVAR
jgi:hypothetical protein